MKLQIQNVCKSFGGKKILEGFSMDFPESGVVCLFGPSGCGKTTLLNCIAGICKPDSGRIIYPESCRISCVFQEDRLLPWYTARENVASVIGGDKKLALDRADEWLRRMGLGGEEKKKPAQLSGGMCRRAAIARALAYGGSLYLLDEPFQRLDEATKGKVKSVVREKICGSLCILVTHDAAEAQEMADITYKLSGSPLNIVDVIQKPTH